MTAQFNLSAQFRRPVMYMMFGGKQYYALLDTGALFPVFNGTRERIERMGGVFVHDKGRFSAFGGTCCCDVYRMPLDFGVFRYTDLPVIRIRDAAMPFAFIISASMFGDFTYTIDNRRKLLTIDTGTDSSNMRFKAPDSSGTIHVLINE